MSRPARAAKLCPLVAGGPALRLEVEYSSSRLPSSREQTGPVAVYYRLGMKSFATDIKPLFRERDRRSMLSHFDLWSFDDVVEHKDAIVEQLAEGDMPCDGPWPADQVELFRSWVAAGTPA
jgi:hypothetical protein